MIGGGVYATRALWRAGSSEPQPLRIPPLLDARKQGQSISLTAQAGNTEFFAGRQSRTLGYNGSYLGPTIRLHRGDDVQMAVTNALGQNTTVHWHGLIVPAELDGSPHQLIRPGDTWRPVLPVRQPAATLFYHSHAHGQTAEQVYRGLAGVLLIADDAQRALGLPSEYGVDDLPLVLQDRQFDNGRMVLPAGMMTAMQGRRGDTFLVNGTPNAVARVPARLVRLRFVDGVRMHASTTCRSTMAGRSTGSPPKAACWTPRCRCDRCNWHLGSGPKSWWTSPTAARPPL
ncbi:MAG TPA: multicopper oxidase domain-containing protein [Burkholderiaceae bacterium]